MHGYIGKNRPPDFKPSTTCARPVTELRPGCNRLAKIQSRPESRLAESHMHRKPEISMFLGRPDRARTDAAIKISVWKIFCAKKSKKTLILFQKVFTNFQNFSKSFWSDFPDRSRSHPGSSSSEPTAETGFRCSSERRAKRHRFERRKQQFLNSFGPADRKIIQNNCDQREPLY